MSVRSSIKRAGLRRLAYPAFSLLLTLFPVVLAAASPPPAEAALNEGRIGDAVALLLASLSRAETPDTHLLLCRSYFAEDLFDQATRQCELAAAAPTSEEFTWLGRVYGARAGRANSLSAFALARKVHAAFERAEALDPRSVQALNDLGEFSIKAPAIVGGDLSRAQALAQQAASLSPCTQHRLLALIARKNKDLSTAEREYLASVSSARPSELASANINLARFYRHTGQTDAALEAVHAALLADSSGDNSLVDAASILTELHREPDTAIRCLRQYVVSPARSDSAPAFKARLQLANLLAASGDQTGARQQRTLALALAPDFVPARKLSQAASESQQVR